jgi:hypothetical protein
MNSAPKYSKVELIILNGEGEHLVEHSDCGMVLTGNYLIIVEDCRDETGAVNSATEGIIYNLDKIKTYKTYKL